MKRPVPALGPAAGLALIAAMLAGCAVPARNIDRVQAGMSPDQVRAIMGPPETVAHAPGKQCAYYALLKDFWSRVPWSLSERYYVCYDDGKVESFGKVDGAEAGGQAARRTGSQ